MGHLWCTGNTRIFLTRQTRGQSYKTFFTLGQIYKLFLKLKLDTMLWLRKYFVGNIRTLQYSQSNFFDKCTIGNLGTLFLTSQRLKMLYRIGPSAKLHYKLEGKGSREAWLQLVTNYFLLKPNWNIRDFFHYLLYGNMRCETINLRCTPQGCQH